MDNDGNNQRSSCPAPPPRGELFSDPGARVVWAAVESLPEAVKHDLLNALRTHLAIAGDRETPHGVRLARAIAALHEAAELHREQGGEGPLAVEVYRRLREQHQQLGWPPDGSVRRWLGGSWNDALRQARLETVPDGDTLKISLGGALTRAEAIVAVRLCAEQLKKIPTLHEYSHWASRLDVVALPGRRPRSQGPFDRVFGGWPNALAAAGVIEAGQSLELTSRDAIRPAAYRYQPEQVRTALREAAERLGRSPRSAEYTRAREELRQQELDAGGPAKARPSYSVILKLYGNWDAALVDAGLPPLGGRGTRTHPPAPRGPKPRWTHEQLKEILREAYAELGDPFTSLAYAGWRKDQMERDRQAGRRRKLPVYDTHWRYFGSWAKAVHAALGGDDTDDGTGHG